MLVTFATWALLFGFYLLFAGQASGAELGAGVISAALGAALGVFVRVRGEHRMKIEAPWARLAGRILTSLARDSVLVAGALARASAGRAVSGRIRSQVFVWGGEQPTAFGRRAVVTLAASVAPNGFVLQPTPDRAALLIHRLVATPPEPDRQWPI